MELVPTQKTRTDQKGEKNSLKSPNEAFQLSLTLQITTEGDQW